MNREHHQRLLELFSATYELPPEERQAVLDRECGEDKAIRNEIEAMLSSHARSSAFLEAPALGRDFRVGSAAEHSESMASLVGQQIAGYKLKRILASGGMGAVYEAVQEQPHRTVALKVMHRGIASRSALRRFEYEAEILAHLRHEGIAQIFEAGTWDDSEDGDAGVPFFVMEHVADARSLTDYAQEHDLSVRQRLTLFVKVCEAVHHGHQKGIIHRDLKPANILVDSSGQPKVIDFGVARATDSDIAITTLRTDVGQLIGTLQYMSPEQCVADPHGIDTRSDVYSLGVVLFELLCDRLPYEVSKVSLYEAARIVKEEPPVRPGTINRALRGDLETITLKALEKDRERRYGSAADLAQDILRYLGNQPVVARPPSAIYRMSKFVRRNRSLVGGLTVVFFLLVGWAATASWQVSVAEEARQDAEDARDAEADQRAIAEEERAQALQEKTLAEVVRGFMHDTLTAIDPARDVSLREVLDQAAETIDEAFPDHPLEEAEVRDMIQAMYYKLAEYGLAELHAREMTAIWEVELGPDDRKTLSSLNQLARILKQQDKRDEAETIYREVLKARRRVFGPDDTDTLESMNNLGLFLQVSRRLDEAETLLLAAVEGYRRVVHEDDEGLTAATHNLAILFSEQYRFDEAEPLYRNVLAILRRTVGNEHSNTIATIHNLGWLMLNMGKPHEAEPLFREAIRTCLVVHGEDHPRTLMSTKALAIALTRLERYEEAEQLLRNVLELQRQRYGDDLRERTGTLTTLAVLLQKTEKLPEAEPILREVLEYWRRTKGDENFDTIESINNLAWQLWKQGEVDEAKTLFNEAIKLGQRVVGREHPSTLTTMQNFAAMLTELGRLAEGESLYRQVLEGRRNKLGNEHPSTLQSMIDLAQVVDNSDQPAEAELLFRAAIETGERVLSPDDPSLPTYQYAFGTYFFSLHNFEEAEHWLLISHKGLNELVGAEDACTQENVTQLVLLYEKWGRPDKAAEWRARMPAADAD